MSFAAAGWRSSWPDLPSGSDRAVLVTGAAPAELAARRRRAIDDQMPKAQLLVIEQHDIGAGTQQSSIVTVR
jgi:hypothetical protein